MIEQKETPAATGANEANLESNKIIQQNDHVFKEIQAASTKSAILSILENTSIEDARHIPGLEVSPAFAIYTQILNDGRIVRDILNFRDYEFTEQDNAKLFLDLYRTRLRVNKTNNKWLLWDGTVLIPDEWGVVTHLAAEVGQIRKLWTLLYNDNKDEYIKAAKWAATSSTSDGIRKLLFFAQDDPSLTVTQEELDPDGYCVNTTDGLINLKTGQKRQPDIRDLLTKKTAYAPGTQGGQLWEETIHNATMGRKDLAEALQRALGSSLIGVDNKDKIFICYGKGANLKSTILETVGIVLGDYSGSCSISTITENQRSTGHSDDLASLKGIRMLRTAEPSKAGKIDESRIKTLTGGDLISASHKHGRTFSFRPQFTLFLSTNHKPEISGRDEGIWRRISFLPFDYIVPPETRDDKFRDKLLEESGNYIMFWLLEGAVDWIKYGWGEWKTVRDATEKYKESEDVLGKFLDDVCIVDPMVSIPSGILQEKFNTWAKNNGEKTFSSRQWSEVLQEHGFVKKKTKQANIWIGVGIALDD